VEAVGMTIACDIEVRIGQELVLVGLCFLMLFLNVNIFFFSPMRNANEIWRGKPEGKRPLEDLGVDGRIILEWILGKWGGVVSNGFIWLRLGNGGWLL
jgi:hypothetical protein